MEYMTEIEATVVSNGENNGSRVWVCDLRWTDFNNKPIHKVEPTFVEITPSTEVKGHIYYSDSVFLPINKKGSVLKSKVIKLYDNTGFRSYPGIALRIFRDERECKMAFSEMCCDVIDDNKEWLKDKKTQFNKRDKNLREMQSSALISLNK